MTTLILLGISLRIRTFLRLKFFLAEVTYFARSTCVKGAYTMFANIQNTYIGRVYIEIIDIETAYIRILYIRDTCMKGICVENICA